MRAATRIRCGRAIGVGVRRTFVVTLACVAALSCARTSTVAQLNETTYGGRPCDTRLSDNLLSTGIRIDTVLRIDSAVNVVKFVKGEIPRYPETLRAEGVQGTVVSTFVVDTTGRVLPGSAVITFETRRQFGNAVCTFYDRAEFTPLVRADRRLTVRVVDAVWTFRLTY